MAIAIYGQLFFSKNIFSMIKINLDKVNIYFLIIVQIGKLHKSTQWILMSMTTELNIIIHQS